MTQPRLRLSWALNVGRGAWWSSFFVYAPIYVVTMGSTGTTGAMVVSVGTGLLYVIPLFGRLAMHMGVRPVIIASFIVAGLATAAVALAGPHVEIGIAFLLIGALAGVALDATTQITFYRAARKRERPEMGMVYGYYRDAASLLPHTLFALLLSFFGLDSVFLAIGLGMFACAWLGRYVPRSM